MTGALPRPEEVAEAVRGGVPPSTLVTDAAGRSAAGHEEAGHEEAGHEEAGHEEAGQPGDEFDDAPVSAGGLTVLTVGVALLADRAAALEEARREDVAPERGYLAVLAYLDRRGEARAARLRPALGRRLARPVTFGWGPRYLHSTGQYHKGGPQRGAFLLVSAEVQRDLRVPGRPYTFGQLQAAQAAGDLRALAERGRPVLRLHLLDRIAGLDAVLEVAGT